MRDVGDPKPESEETLLAASAYPPPPPAGEEASEKRCTPGAPGQDWGPGAVAAGLGGAGEQWGEELREPALHLCGRHASAGGPGNTRPPPLASPALAPRTKGELACLLDLFFFFFKGLTDLSREPGLPVGFCVWLQEEFFL